MYELQITSPYNKHRYMIFVELHFLYLMIPLRFTCLILMTEGLIAFKKSLQILFFLLLAGHGRCIYTGVDVLMWIFSVTLQPLVPGQTFMPHMKDIP